MRPKVGIVEAGGYKGSQGAMRRICFVCGGKWTSEARFAGKPGSKAARAHPRELGIPLTRGVARSYIPPTYNNLHPHHKGK